MSALPYRWAEPWWGWAGRSPLWSWRCTCRCRSSRNGTSRFGSAEGGWSPRSGHPDNSGGRSRESSNLRKSGDRELISPLLKKKNGCLFTASPLGLDLKLSPAQVLFVPTHYQFWGKKVKTTFTILTSSRSHRSHLRSQVSYLVWRVAPRPGGFSPTVQSSSCPCHIWRWCSLVRSDLHLRPFAPPPTAAAGLWRHIPFPRPVLLPKDRRFAENFSCFQNQSCNSSPKKTCFSGLLKQA